MLVCMVILVKRIKDIWVKRRGISRAEARGMGIVRYESFPLPELFLFRFLVIF
jgi:hypothetical protein